jgi:hypothetical protein
MKISMMQIGVSGTGKTYNSLTFPKCYHISFGRGEEDTILSNPLLKENLVKTVSMLPLNDEDNKKKLDIDNGRTAELCKCIDEARQMFKDGKVETLVIDPITYLAENLWMMIERYYVLKSNNGVVNTMGMYGDLARRLYRILVMEIMNFPGNVIVNVHLKVEDEEALEKLPQAERENPYVPAILGGIRHEIKGWFSLVVYLEKQIKGTGYDYLSRTNLGNQRMAKSRYPLPTIMSSLSYKDIMSAIEKANKVA